MFHSATLRAVPDAPRLHPPTAEVWRRHPGYLGAFVCDLIIAGGLGQSALTSDPLRFSTPAYAFVRLTGVTTWGVILCVLTAALIAGAFTQARVVRWFLALSAAAYLLLAVWFYNAASLDLRAAWWGTWVFFGVGCWQLTQQNEYRRTIAEVRAEAEAEAAELDEPPADDQPRAG